MRTRRATQDRFDRARVDLFTAGVAWITSIGVCLAGGVRGVLDIAVNWMGLDLMLGCVDRDVLRKSAWPVAVSTAGVGSAKLACNRRRGSGASYYYSNGWVGCCIGLKVWISCLEACL